MTGTKDEFEILDDLSGPQFLAQLLGDDQLLGFASGGREVDSGRGQLTAAVAVRQVVDQDAGGVDTGFGFGRARLRTSAKPLDFAAYFIGEGGVFIRLGFEVGLARFQKIAVAAGGFEHALRVNPIEFDHPLRHRFKEAPVMADHEVGAGLGFQQPFEPENALDVQMVRRLVHHQHVRLHQEGAGDRKPLLPSPGEGPHELVGVRKFPQAQGAGDTTAFLVRIQSLLTQRLGQHFFHGQVGRKGGFLRDITQADVAAQGAGAVVGVLDAGENLQQGGLT